MRNADVSVIQTHQLDSSNSVHWSIYCATQQQKHYNSPQRVNTIKRCICYEAWQFSLGFKLNMNDSWGSKWHVNAFVCQSLASTAERVIRSLLGRVSTPLNVGHLQYRHEELEGILDVRCTVGSLKKRRYIHTVDT